MDINMMLFRMENRDVIISFCHGCFGDVYLDAQRKVTRDKA